jgi:hypothetical protein
MFTFMPFSKFARLMLALARPTFPTRRLGLPGPQETTFTGPPVPEAGTDEWLRAEVVYPVVEAVRHLLQFGTGVQVVSPQRPGRRRPAPSLSWPDRTALPEPGFGVCPTSRHGHPADTDASGGLAGFAGSVH